MHAEGQVNLRPIFDWAMVSCKRLSQPWVGLAEVLFELFQTNPFAYRSS